ncbi:hypothetical protein ACTNDP_20740 [Paenibacillus barengoltzii]|uniref:hypothetical protein n=1 Tax=Paenibacillus barengoltzii TaxID=343517 RepID=UPI003F8B8D74
MVAYLCGLPLEGCLWGEVAGSFARLRRFPLLLFGQKQFQSPPNCFCFSDIMLVAICNQSVVHVFLKAHLDTDILGIVLLWPSCSWTQNAHLTFRTPQINTTFCTPKSQTENSRILKKNTLQRHLFSYQIQLVERL